MKFTRLLLFRAKCSNKNIWNLLSLTRAVYHKNTSIAIYRQMGFEILDVIVSEKSLRTSVTKHISDPKYHFDPDKPILSLYQGLLKLKKDPQTFIGECGVKYTPGMLYDVHIVYDLVFDENLETDSFEDTNDPISLQYLLLILVRLAASKNHFKFDVFMSKANGSLSGPHIPLSYSKTVVRMRTFLLLCSQRSVFPGHADILDHFRVFYSYKRNEPRWNAFIDEQTELEPIGRIVPFVPITEETHTALKSQGTNGGGASTLINSIYNGYLERYIIESDIYKELTSFRLDNKNNLKGCVWLAQHLDSDEILFLNNAKTRIILETNRAALETILNNDMNLNDKTSDSFIQKTEQISWEKYVLWLLDVNSFISGKQLRLQLNKSDQKSLFDSLADRLMKIIISETTREPENIIRIKKKLNTTMRWKDVMSADTLLEKLMFIATLYYYTLNEKEEKRSIDFKNEEISFLHEICIDYAQGIFQLIENAWFHVIGADSNNGVRKERGCGGFVIRIRKKEDIKSFLNDNDFNQKKHDLNTNNTTAIHSRYFMEVHVTDLQFDLDNFKSVVQVFCDNVQSRAINSEDLGFEAAKRLCEEGNIEKINIKHLFGAEDYDPLIEYLNDPANVAFHYGLQILNNVIETGDGYYFVRSGAGEENCFSSTNSYYKKQSIDWQNGTAYMMLLPISMEERIDYTDALAVRNDPGNQLDDRQIIPVLGACISSGYTAHEKEVAVNKTKGNLLENITGKRSIFLIDCDKYKNGLDYEVLAKAIFLCSARENDKEPIFALVNVKNRQEVIKLFRQFALFYNRKGKCNEKLDRIVIFIVDKNAEVDILLQGSLNSITKNMYLNQIYGGIDSRAIRIIEHLGGRGL